jgi:serine phosphatase RsbU (regulator of sigma subunit)
MMKKAFILIFSVALAFSTSGQINRYGVPIIRNYSTQITGAAEQNWCIAKDKQGNIYFGNQDRGVVRYDGTKWTRIDIGKTNPRIYSLEADTSGIVYVGSSYEFGYIQAGRNGKPEFVSLASRVDSINKTGVFLSIMVKNGKVFYLSPRKIFEYDIQKDTLSEISIEKFGLREAIKIVDVNGRKIISDNKQGLFEFRGDSVIPLPGGDFFKNKICLVMLQYDKSKMLIGTFYDGVYLYDFESGITETNFIDKNLNEKLKQARIYSGTRISHDLFALGTTQDEGVVIFDKSGKLVYQINSGNSGIEENTILALYCDNSSNSDLWISTQGFISKAYLNLPLTQFSEKQGIKYGLNGICEYQDRIYLSTDGGVLRSYITDQNTVAFEEVSGSGGEQVFPLVVIKNKYGDFVLAGSINGIFQIRGNEVRKIRNNDILGKIEEGKTGMVNAKSIVQSDADPSVVYVGLNSGGVRIIRYDGNKWNFVYKIPDNPSDIPGYINGMAEGNNGLWFITDDPGALYHASFGETDTTFVKYGDDKGISNLDINSISNIGGEIYITTSLGIMKYDRNADKFISDNTLTGGFSAQKNSTNLFRDEDGDIWFSEAGDKVYEMLFRKNGENDAAINGILNLLPNVTCMGKLSADSKIYLLKSKSLYVIDKSQIKHDSVKLNTLFTRIIAGTDSVVMEGSFFKTDNLGRRIPVQGVISAPVPEFSYDMNEISFEWTTPYFTEELLTEYSYKLEGLDKEWSKWEGISYGNTMEAQYFKKDYTNLPYGVYTFHVRTRTLTGQSGDGLTYKFIILKPWYATFWAFIGFLIAGFLIIYYIIKAYTKKLKNENIRLEGIVAERTAVVVKQKEELESSIHYASRIQMALLPSEEVLAGNIRNYFVLFKPRDIVSGDFYWMTKKDERLYIVAADCTGHGVPGAFMSLLGMSFLDEIIDKDKDLRADRILKELRHHVTESLKQVGNENEAKDGMDIALLVIDFGKSKIEFSGAYNPCYKVRKLKDRELTDFSDQSDGLMNNGKYVLETIYASKMPIGISSRMDEDFVYHEWELERGVSYYLFSDGYLDQFGGPDGRKFMKKNFKKLILDIQDYPMPKQKELLDDNLKKWMGNSPQIDDILVMGIRTE